jgi:hypothetical protein
MQSNLPAFMHEATIVHSNNKEVCSCWHDFVDDFVEN